MKISATQTNLQLRNAKTYFIMEVLDVQWFWLCQYSLGGGGDRDILARGREKKREGEKFVVDVEKRNADSHFSSASQTIIDYFKAHMKVEGKKQRPRGGNSSQTEKSRKEYIKVYNLQNYI